MQFLRLKFKMKRTQFITLLRKRIPITNWLMAYSVNDALGDLVAGLTVGLTLIPQAIAYASLAGLGPQYGLYSAFAGSLIYIAFGTCKEINIGPTALISLLTFTYTRGVAEYAILLCFLSGCVTTILGISQLGFLLDFVSTPVVGAFTSAASLIIACSQIKGLLGLSFQSENFIEMWRNLSYHIQETKLPDLILSCCCIIVLLVLRIIKDVKTSRKFLNKFFWLLGTARNAIVVVVCAIISYYFETRYRIPFILTGHIDAGLPIIKPPPFHTNFANETVGFIILCKTLGSGILVISLVSIIGNVAIVKAFSHGKTLDATQEMLTLGFCNLVGSFFQSIPVAGSFSRSAVNNASGVKTPFGGLYTSILVILALSLLTPYFYYIPKATLSSVIMCAVIFMIEVSMIKSIWKCSKRDLFPAFTTFFSCLFIGVELGILVGIVTDVAVLIYFHARPTIHIEHNYVASPPYIIIRPSTGLMFLVIDYLRTYIMKSLSKKKLKSDILLNYVIIDCKHVNTIDFTAAQGINSIIKDLKDIKYHLILMNIRPDIVNKIQSFSNEPILSIKLELELLVALKQIDKNIYPDIVSVDKPLEINSTYL